MNRFSRLTPWRASWGSAPAPAMSDLSALPAQWSRPDLTGRTVVQSARLSAGGRRVRLRLTHEYGEGTLELGPIRIARSSGAATSNPGRLVTFAGAAQVAVGAGEAVVSDPVDVPIPSLTQLKISIFVARAGDACTWHADGGDWTCVSPPGDFTDKPFAPDFTTQSRPLMSAIEVEGGPDGPVIVALGDSITDGYLSSVGRHRRWPDRLAERLAVDSRLSAGAVVNAGISGNRLLSSDPTPAFGESILARLDRDALGVSGVTHLILLAGVNDLCAPSAPTAETMIAAYDEIIRRSLQKGVRAILGTILAYSGSDYFNPDAELVRQTVNQWIRSRPQDAFVDFDQVLRDLRRPERLSRAFHAGDHMHPNDAGLRRMADAVPLHALQIA